MAEVRRDESADHPGVCPLRSRHPGLPSVAPPVLPRRVRRVVPGFRSPAATFTPGYGRPPLRGSLAGG